MTPLAKVEDLDSSGLRERDDGGEVLGVPAPVESTSDRAGMVSIVDEESAVVIAMRLAGDEAIYSNGT